MRRREEKRVCISKKTLILVSSSLNLIEWIERGEKFRLDIHPLYMTREGRTNEWKRGVCAKWQEIEREYAIKINFRKNMSILLLIESDCWIPLLFLKYWNQNQYFLKAAFVETLNQYGIWKLICDIFNKTRRIISLFCLSSESSFPKWLPIDKDIQLRFLIIVYLNCNWSVRFSSETFFFNHLKDLSKGCEYIVSR